MNAVNHAFRYLDGDDERRELIADIRRTRQTVIQVAENVPENRRYEPRYHGWSLGAMLMHLHVMDRLGLLSIQLALIGVHIPAPAWMLDAFNDRTARLFQKRLIETTLRGIRRNERPIADFILRLPMDRFTRQVFYPPDGEYMTVERAVQQYFLFHWQDHLMEIQKAEGVYYEPPGRHDTI